MGKELNSLIRDRRIEIGLTQLEVAKACGVTEATVSRWESGHIANMKRGKVALLAKALRLTPSEILGIPQEGSIEQIPSGYISMPPMKEIPIIGKAACGTPITAQQESDGTAGIPASWHVDFAIRAVGDSMAPDIRDGDIVAIRSQHTVDNGQIAAVHIGEEATLKRLFYYPEKGRLELRPINPAYELQVYYGDELADVVIDGLAIGLCRSFE